MQHKNWSCIKCGGNNFEVAEVRNAGGFWAAFFDMSNKRFTTVSCSSCSYTELYRTDLPGIQKIFDFLSGA